MISNTQAMMLAGASAVITLTSSVSARQVTAHYDLPSQDLATALRQVGQIAHVEIMFDPSDVAGITTTALRGDFTVPEAVQRLIATTGLSSSFTHGTVIIRGRSSPPSGESAGSAGGGSDIVVTGSRIRGARIASPVITLTREDMKNQGKTSLGDVVRDLPQSYGGGQNPGVGINVPSANGVDIGGGSSINLRGLGSDATLTLLDGRRLAFTGSRQSIDVSAIPFGAVERLEIVPDGSSAIYGSDAVAGVANIILRRKFDGLEVGARLAAASDGGDFQQQYWATAGTTWRGGSAVAAYENGSNSAIVGNQRSFATSKPGLTLFPALLHNSGSLVVDQALTDRLSLELDGLVNVRKSSTTFPTAPNGDITVGRATNAFIDRSWVIAPTLRLALSGSWRLTLSGNLGREKVDTTQVTCAASTCTLASSGYYRNSERATELSGDGALFPLPGGDAKVALGGGYRSIGFDRFAVNGAAVNTQHDQSSYYGFGELDLPFVGSAQGVPFMDRLIATAAIRYERYPGIGGIATPKIGLIYAPSPDFEVKGSWGRSFRAPTQYQQYQPRAVAIFPPSVVGGTALPATATVLYVQGGNPALKPERATTWSATFVVHPRALPGARLELSYFNVAYRDRIVSPIAFVSQALTNPLYASQVTLNPSPATQAAILAGASTVVNATGLPYEAANVVAIVDNASVNAGRQTAHGIDILGSYRVDLSGAQSLTINADASYLDSAQQISSSQPIIPLSGRIFSPPHWRGQGTLAYASGPLTLASTLTYAGGVLDSRKTVFVPVHGMTMLDLTGRYRLAGVPGPLRGVELIVSVANLSNAKPDVIATTAVTDTPYDSTNYSPVGRLVSVSISKRF